MFTFFVTETVTTFRSFQFCYPHTFQFGWQQSRPRGWCGDRRGSQDQQDDHQHQVRLSLPSTTTVFLLIIAPTFCYRDGNNIPIIPRLPLQFGVERHRPRGWCGYRRGSQDQQDDHQHQVRLSLPSTTTVFLLIVAPTFCYRDLVTTFQHSDFVTPSFFSLGWNEVGPEGGIAIAEVLKVNSTITTIRYGAHFPLLSPLHSCIFCSRVPFQFVGQQGVANSDKLPLLQSTHLSPFFPRTCVRQSRLPQFRKQWYRPCGRRVLIHA